VGLDKDDSMDKQKQPIGGTAIKPPGWDRTGFEAFKYMIWNPDTGEILTRTPISWLKITVFYCIYYACLTGFWLACMYVFFMTVPKDNPKWKLDESIIGTNPGVGIRPSNTKELVDSSMFVIKVGDSSKKPTGDGDGEGNKNIDYAIRTRNYLDKYKITDGMKNCEEGSEGEFTDHRSCIFDLSVLGECAEYPYGFLAGGENAQLGSSKYAEPCLFVKFNKIFDWQPRPIKSDNITETLADPKYDKMSQRLKDIIVKSSNRDYIWIDCFGRYAADQEVFSIDYFPENQGIPTKYFPFSGGNYHAPLVALKVRENKEAWGQLQHIECRAWFDGVEHITKDKAGLVQFEVHMLAGDENTKFP